MDRRAWQATGHGIAKSGACLSVHTHTHNTPQLCSEYKSFASVSYFIIFDVVVNGTVSFMFRSDLSVYRNPRDLCVFVLYPASLPNSLMSSSSFLVIYLTVAMRVKLEFSHHNNCNHNIL